MRPYRFRSLPSKTAALTPNKAKKPFQPDPTESLTYYDASGLNTTAIFLLASCLKPDIQEDMQRLYPFLPQNAQSVASAAMTVKANSARMVEGARIRAAVLRHDSHTGTDTGQQSFFDALTQTNMVKKHQLEEPISHTADALGGVQQMQKTLSKLRREGSQAFLSRHVESRLKQSLGNAAPFLSAVKRQQSAKEQGEHPKTGNIANPLHNMLMNGQANNPLFSMLIQGIMGKRQGNPASLSMEAPNDYHIE